MEGRESTLQIAELSLEIEPGTASAAAMADERPGGFADVARELEKDRTSAVQLVEIVWLVVVRLGTKHALPYDVFVRVLLIFKSLTTQIFQNRTLVDLLLTPKQNHTL